MISIKKYLLGGKTRESDEAFERMALQMLQAIGLHAVEGDRDDYDWFRSTIKGLQISLEADSSPTNILVSTGSAVKALQDYNLRASHFIRAKSSELQVIVGMLTQAMSQISTGSEVSIARLQELQKEIRHASMLEDMRTLKTRLSECLESIRTETVRHRDESARVVTELDHGLRTAREPMPLPVTGNIDPLTGIPLRPQAEEAMRELCETGKHAYAGLFVLDRIQAISARFGFAMGDQVVLFFKQHLAQRLSPEDQLFRWSPSSFLALMHREASPDQVRRDLGRFLSRRFEQSFEVDNHSVVLPIALTWVIVPLINSNFADALHKLELFAAASPAKTAT